MEERRRADDYSYVPKKDNEKDDKRCNPKCGEIEIHTQKVKINIKCKCCNW